METSSNLKQWIRFSNNKAEAEVRDFKSNTYLLRMHANQKAFSVKMYANFSLIIKSCKTFADVNVLRTFLSHSFSIIPSSY